MSAVKRLPSTDEIERPLKKVKRSETPLEELTEGGLLSQDDVIYYQKEAIYRMMNLVRHRNSRLKKELCRMNDSYSTLNKYYAILNNWWSQIIDSFKNFDLVSKVDDGEVTEYNQHLLISIPSSEDENLSPETKQVEDDLRNKRTKLIALLQPLLSQPVKNRDEKLVDLEESLTNLNVFKSRLEDENKLLKEKIEELNQELDKYVKFVELKNSKSLERISDNLHDREELKIEEDGEIKEESKTPLDYESDKVKTEKDNSEALKASNSELEDLRVQLSELRVENKTMSGQLSERLDKIGELEKQVAELKAGMSNLSEQDLLKSSEYQALVAKNTELSSQLSQVKFTSSKVESQFYELESKLTSNKEKLEAKLKAEVDANNAYVAKLESDINRIRSDRDSCRAENSILKAEKGKSELTEQYKSLNETLQTRIDQLEATKEKELDLPETAEDSAALAKHNRLLSKELKQMEEAFKSTRQKASAKLAKYAESDSYINKLNVEKSKADEKYFQAMRTKDALTLQNKVLNGNVAKQAELIDVLKANEGRLLKKLEVENSLYSKLKDLESIYNNDLTFQRNRSKEVEIKLRVLRENNSELQSSLVKKQEAISQKDKKISLLESHDESLKSKVEELERLIGRYRSNSTTTEDEEINQALLTMTKCQLCNKNFKNVTLKSCGHCFCNECISNRLSSRMRKCPSCNKQFSNYDLLSIHL
ncbi:DEKNAAC103264 [Brettanomyces naardenensis]|uniref:E3 ubiquitin protein ligase n=1 Tax=Brettanomyces naardenensis TaxID=13370 RepID=A0A448YMY3_BRENA|nr:DEKNAAC103264 [Brettanomyces naardenensis]